MSILTRIHDRFVEQRLPEHVPAGVALSESDFADMYVFNAEIDRWRTNWHARQEPNHFIGTFPMKGIIMYSFFAKLQLNSLAVRGVSISHGRLSAERKEFANMAITAAMSILHFVQEEEDIRRALVGMPLYFHTMITFAAVFLMKVTAKWSSIVGLNVDSTSALELLERAIALFQETVTSERHLLHHIGAGLEKMLAKSRACTPGLVRVDDRATSAQMTHATQPATAYGSSHFQHSQPLMAPMPTAQPLEAYGGPWGSFNPSDMSNEIMDVTIMNDGWIQESFGLSDSTNAVYNLLTSQFSY